VTTWLPEPPPEEPEGLPLWQPEDIDPAGLCYIVVDELLQGIAGLVVSPWPHVDERGRLRFGRERESQRVSMRADELQDLLDEHREPLVADDVGEAERDALRTRAVTIGDVFAARFDGAPAPPILDVTGPARVQAKTQTSAALSGAMSMDYLDDVEKERKRVAGD
jgi:hypothetical protein